MPKDDWAKARRRDIARKAERDQFHKATKRRRRKAFGKRYTKPNIQVAKSERFVTFAEWLNKIRQATTHEQLDAIGRDLVSASYYVWSHDYARIVAAGTEKRRELNTTQKDRSK